MLILGGALIVIDPLSPGAENTMTAGNKPSSIARANVHAVLFDNFLIFLEFFTLVHPFNLTS